MFRLFENLLAPYPEAEPQRPPQGFFRFVWSCTQGMRGYLLALSLLSAAIAAYEAWLFAVLGKVVDWLGQTPREELFQRMQEPLLLFAAVLLGSIVLIAGEALVKRQTLSMNVPLRLRWNFHRLMLGQSMAFYADEFAGRVTTKVMQTGFSVREVLFASIEVGIGIGVYFLSILVLTAGFDARLMLPFIGWAALFALSIWFFVPRLGRAGKKYADAKAVVTGRISDAYANITTVKLFSHSRREAVYLRNALHETGVIGYYQMRLVTGFEIVNHTLVVLLILAAVGQGLWLWSQGAVGAGAVAAVGAMALRVGGMSQWIMWSVAGLFENIGTVQDGLATLTKPRNVVDAPEAKPLEVSRGEVKFERVDFSYGGKSPVIRGLDLTVRPGEKIGLIGRSGAGKSTLVNLLLRFYDLDGGRILIDGQDIAHATQDSLRASIGMVTQDTSLLHRSVRDNIVYGRPGASDEDMRAAARRAEAEEFIARLQDPQGRQG